MLACSLAAAIERAQPRRSLRNIEFRPPRLWLLLLLMGHGVEMKDRGRIHWMISAISSGTRVCLLAVGAIFFVCEADADTVHQFSYLANHAVFGRIGTYTNIIEQTVDSTTIRTTVHLQVSAMGVVLHREDAERMEHWKGDRVIDFHGITTTNGQTMEVTGRARDDGFLITLPQGNVIMAPPTVRLSNPWSGSFLSATTMMRTDTGKIENVRISGGKQSLVTIAGASVQTHLYQVDGSTRYKVWIDQQNTPVKFSVDDESGEVSFSLVR